MTDVEIIQLHDIDEDGEIGSRQDSWYAEGHVDQLDFIKAIVDHCADWGDDIPRIPLGRVKHQYLHKAGGFGGSWTADFRDEVPEGWRKGDWEPVTTFEAERKFGGISCAVSDCRKSVRRRLPLMAVFEPEDVSRLCLYVNLCTKHAKQMPEPFYRVVLVPVGAIIKLPSISPTPTTDPQDNDQ